MKSILTFLFLLPTLVFASNCSVDANVKNVVELIHFRSMPCEDVLDFLDELDKSMTGDQIQATDVTCEIVKENLIVKNDFVNCPAVDTGLHPAVYKRIYLNCFNHKNKQPFNRDVEKFIECQKI